MEGSNQPVRGSSRLRQSSEVPGTDQQGVALWRESTYSMGQSPRVSNVPGLECSVPQASCGSARPSARRSWRLPPARRGRATGSLGRTATFSALRPPWPMNSCPGRNRNRSLPSAPCRRGAVAIMDIGHLFRRRSQAPEVRRPPDSTSGRTGGITRRRQSDHHCGWQFFVIESDSLTIVP